MFDNHAARIAANTLRAQCLDLGMTEVQAHPNGDVQADLEGHTYLFRWNVPQQAVVLLAVEPPMTMEIQL